jgi:hypothetical protein
MARLLLREMPGWRADVKWTIRLRDQHDREYDSITLTTGRLEQVYTQFIDLVYMSMDFPAKLREIGHIVQRHSPKKSDRELAKLIAMMALCITLENGQVNLPNNLTPFDMEEFYLKFTDDDSVAIAVRKANKIYVISGPALPTDGDYRR